MHLNKNFWWCAAISLAVLILWVHNGDHLFLGGSLSLLMLILWSFLSTLFSLRKIEVQKLSKIKRQQAGTYYNERVKIINHSRFNKTWIELSDSHDHLNISKPRVISNIGKKSIRLINTPIFLKKRGVYKLGPGIIRSGDLLGLFSIEKKVPISSENLVVYPYFEIVDNFAFHPGTEFGGSDFRKQNPSTTPQAAGIREFTPGDPLNRVHWPKTVKMNKLMVKEFDEDTQSNIWIFLDAQAGIHIREKITPSGFEEKTITFLSRKTKYQLAKDSLEYAISIGATLTDFYIRKNKSVGLVCNSSPFRIINPERGRDQYIKIIDSLTLVEDNGNYSLISLLKKQIQKIPQGSSILIITPISPKDILNEIESIKSQGIRVFIISIERVSFYKEDNYAESSQSHERSLLIKYGDDIQKRLSGMDLYLQ